MKWPAILMMWYYTIMGSFAGQEMWLADMWQIKRRQVRSSLCYHWTLRKIWKQWVNVTTVGATFQPTPMSLCGPNLILLVLATNRQLSVTGKWDRFHQISPVAPQLNTTSISKYMFRAQKLTYFLIRVHINTPWNDFMWFWFLMKRPHSGQRAYWGPYGEIYGHKMEWNHKCIHKSEDDYHMNVSMST